jgi:hypothetical protein
VLGNTSGADGHYRDLARHPDVTTTPGVVVLRIDVSAAQMPTDLDQQLQSRGVRLLIARDIGQFRDVLEHAPGHTHPPPGYRTIADAITASSAGVHDHRYADQADRGADQV